LELNVSDPEQMLDRFLQTCTVRQVRMLREIALEPEEPKLQLRPHVALRRLHAFHLGRFR
jgi:hypothetical protein